MIVMEKIETLIAARINGNNIKGNKTYENMLNSIRVRDFWFYANTMGWELGEAFYGTKLEIIESLRNSIEGAI